MSEKEVYMFCTLCLLFPHLSWRVKKGKSFYAGLNTPEGEIIYEIDINYWDLFETVHILKSAPCKIEKDVHKRFISLID